MGYMLKSLKSVPKNAPLKSYDSTENLGSTVNDINNLISKNASVGENVL
jgi:hypothetical protein